MASIKHYIIVGNKKYEYVLKPARTRTTIVCSDADINRTYSNHEIPAILANLPDIILALQRANAQTQSEALRFRVTPEEKERIAQDALNAGYDTISAYLRDIVLGKNDKL